MLANRGELDGKRILKSETVDLAFTNQLDRIKQPPLRFQFGPGFAIEDPAASKGLATSCT